MLTLGCSVGCSVGHSWAFLERLFGANYSYTHFIPVGTEKFEEFKFLFLSLSLSLSLSYNPIAYTNTQITSDLKKVSKIDSMKFYEFFQFQFFWQLLIRNFSRC